MNSIQKSNLVLTLQDRGRGGIQEGDTMLVSRKNVRSRRMRYRFLGYFGWIREYIVLTSNYTFPHLDGKELSFQRGVGGYTRGYGGDTVE